MERKFLIYNPKNNITPEENEGVVIIKSIKDAHKMDSIKETDVLYIDLDNIFQECKKLKSGD